LRAFPVVWIGQTVSLVGSSLTSFALGVSVFQDSGSISAFAFVGLFAVLPRVLLSPISGVLVDRWDRRRAMMLSDAGAGACTLILVVILLIGRLELWQIYLLTAASSAFGSIQWPAYMAAIPLLVPKANLGRANGLIQLAFAFGEILAPPLAAFLLSRIALAGVILVDCATFLFAVGTLLRIRFPAVASAPPGEERRPFLPDLLEGVRFILGRQGLAVLLGYASASRFFWGMVAALLTPMILLVASTDALGAILAVAGIGMLAGSLAMSVWGGPVPRIRGILVFEIISGLAFLLIGVRSWVWLVGAGVFFAHTTIAIVDGSSHALWQAKVPRAIQGRVFSVQQMVVSAAFPAAYLVAGLLTESVFEPFVRSHGALAQLIGSGPGRGIGLLFVVMGLVKLVLGGLIWSDRRVRNVERDLPDEGYASVCQVGE
jgi:DHA3 family macrolide efflux protein-like MFS transporter